MTMTEWNKLAVGREIWWREYEFTRGATATTLAIRVDDGVVVVSPSVKTPEAAFTEITALGPVRALIATNALHHFGQREWRERFPEAETFGPPRALAVLGKKLPGIPVRPLNELALPAWIHWEDAPGFKTGETFLRISSGTEHVWFVGDLIANIQSLPPIPLRWLFQITNSAPGLRLFRLATWVFVSDKKAVRAWLEAQFDAFPPAALIPAHGPPISDPDLPARVRVQLARM